MPARWRMAAAILSGDMFLATGILWVRSYFIYDELQRFTSHGNTELETSDGGLGLLSQRFLQPMPPVQSHWRFAHIRLARGQTNFLESLIDFRWRPRTVTVHSRPGSIGPAVYSLRVITIYFRCGRWFFPSRSAPVVFFPRPTDCALVDSRRYCMDEFPAPPACRAVCDIFGGGCGRWGAVWLDRRHAESVAIIRGMVGDPCDPPADRQLSRH